jgi:hypothetical protein
VIVIKSCDKSNDKSSEWVLTITLIAIIIAQDKSADEIGILAAILVQLGDTLTTIAAIREANNQNENTVF